MSPPRTLLITGPGGSGKSTLAATVAARLGWTCLSEDHYWVENGWGSGRRRMEHESVVQAQVIHDLLAAVDAGGGAVLELILYRVPPNPLTAYQDVLVARGITFATIVLKPSVAEVLRRMQQRGRPTDADLVRRRMDATWQISILGPGCVEPAWIIDPTDLTPEATADLALARLGTGSGIEGAGGAGQGAPGKSDGSHGQGW